MLPSRRADLASKRRRPSAGDARRTPAPRPAPPLLETVATLVARRRGSPRLAGRKAARRQPLDPKAGQPRLGKARLCRVARPGFTSRCSVTSPGFRSRHSVMLLWPGFPSRRSVTLPRSIGGFFSLCVGTAQATPPCDPSLPLLSPRYHGLMEQCSVGLSGVLFAFLVIDSRLQGVSISRCDRRRGSEATDAFAPQPRRRSRGASERTSFPRCRVAAQRAPFSPTRIPFSAPLSRPLALAAFLSALSAACTVS